MPQNIPVRMPDDLYQAIKDSKPDDLKISQWLLVLLRAGLSTSVDTHRQTPTTPVNSSIEELVEVKISSHIQAVYDSIDTHIQERIQPLQRELAELRGK